MVTMDWLLSMISAHIANSEKKFFVIDIVPTMAAIQKCASFQKLNHDEDMENFEKQVTFILKLLFFVS